MLEIINRYSHGYAFIPGIEALKRRRTLEYMLDRAQFTEQELVQQGLNRGYLAVILHMLESVGMIESRGGGEYVVTDLLQLCSSVPTDAMALFDFPFQEYL